MKFQIKNRFTGNILFSVETDSWKLAVEAGIKAKANLSWANLSKANLSEANLPAPTMVLLARCCAALREQSFDTLAYSGNSGGLIAPVLAHILGKELMMVRKPGVKCVSRMRTEGFAAARRLMRRYPSWFNTRPEPEPFAAIYQGFPSRNHLIVLRPCTKNNTTPITTTLHT